jgi:hypothetical protein
LAAGSEAPTINEENALAEHTQFRFEDLSRSASIASGVNEEIVEEGPETAFDDIGCNSLGFLEIEPAMEQQYGFIADAGWIHTVGEPVRYVDNRLAGV